MNAPRESRTAVRLRQVYEQLGCANDANVSLWERFNVLDLAYQNACIERESLRAAVEAKEKLIDALELERDKHLAREQANVPRVSR